ncbi:acyltransferase [Actinoplanes sp. NPDC051633]|uniref:acyltransferase family protein n=1 Tax=Actinoplanes sp. NPDC051633 TaxID=3155670 RepID=UPI0034262B80
MRHAGSGRHRGGVRRRPELDAIRLVVVIGLVFFHSALVFDPQADFYVRNRDTTPVTTVLAALGVVWAMPVLFLIAGLGAWHSLRRRGPAGFATERLLRLGVPLLFVTVALTPIPQWLRRRSDPGYDESYPRFLRRFFDVHLEWPRFPFVLQGPDFETGHLWFVLLLLTFSLLLAPAAGGALGARPARVVDRMAEAVVRRRGLVLLPAVPVAAVCALFGIEQGYGVWSRAAYLLFFGYGLLLAADERFRTAMRRAAKPAAVLGVALFAAAMAGFASVDDPLTAMTLLATGARGLYGLAGWCWLVAILGFSDRPQRAATARTRPQQPRAYRRLAAVALPFYLLHQPIIVIVADQVVRLPAPILVKYVIIVAASLALTIAACDLVVRRTRVTRVLFGMRAPREAEMKESRPSLPPTEP